METLTFNILMWTEKHFLVHRSFYSTYSITPTNFQNGNSNGFVHTCDKCVLTVDHTFYVHFMHKRWKLSETSFHKFYFIPKRV